MKLLTVNTSQLNTAIRCVNSAKNRLELVQTKLKREIVVMDEKNKVRNK